GKTVSRPPAAPRASAGRESAPCHRCPVRLAREAGGWRVHGRVAQTPATAVFDFLESEGASGTGAPDGGRRPLRNARTNEEGRVLDLPRGAGPVGGHGRCLRAPEHGLPSSGRQ